MKVLKTRFRATGPDLKAELKEIVKENPDAAATIVVGEIRPEWRRLVKVGE